jgi:iron complex outermembrane recepter protein
MSADIKSFGARRPVLQASLVALAAMMGAGQASAQDAADGAAADDEIIVVAQRRAESLQDVPLAISAFTADRLDEAQIEDATDLQYSIPNAVLTGNDRFTIRGIGNNSLGGENGVGTFVNGAAIGYLPQNEFFDLERIEVLRGPQGTLYGRNTTGGAVNVLTRRPGDEFGGDLSVQVGNFESVRIGGALNIPLGDNAGQRFAAYYLDRDGYTENLATGNNIDGRHQWGFRSSTHVDFSPDTSADLVVGWFEEDSSRAREAKRLCTADPVLGCSPTSLGFDSPNSFTTILRTLLDADFVLPPSVFPNGTDIYAGAPNPRDLRKVAADTDPTFTAEQLFATLEFSHDFGGLTVTSVTGYSQSETEQNTDWDNADLPFRFGAPLTYSVDRDTVVTTNRLLTTDRFAGDNTTWTQELRLSSDFDGVFNYTIGAFYLDSEGSGAFQTWHPAVELFQRALGRPAETWFVNTTTPLTTTEARAVFGQGYLALSPDTTLTLGARYTEEEKFSRSRAIILTGVVPFIEAGQSWENWTGRIALDHQLTDDNLLYASISTGFKGGGLNPGNATAPSFDPETVTAFETGSNNMVFDRTLRANFAAFYYDYADLQLGQRINAGVTTRNADATVWGLEAEFDWRPTDHLQFDMNLSHLNTEIGTFLSIDAANPAQSLTATTPTVLVNLAGNHLPHSPEYKAKLGAQFSWELGGGWESTARVDMLWQDDYFAREYNSPTDVIGAWGTIDLQLRLTSPNGVEFRGFVKNLTDEDNITNIIIEDALIGRYRNVRILEPLTFGLIVSTDY